MPDLQPLRRRRLPAFVVEFNKAIVLLLQPSVVGRITYRLNTIFIDQKQFPHSDNQVINRHENTRVRFIRACDENSGCFKRHGATTVTTEMSVQTMLSSFVVEHASVGKLRQ